MNWTDAAEELRVKMWNQQFIPDTFNTNCFYCLLEFRKQAIKKLQMV